MQRTRILLVLAILLIASILTTGRQANATPSTAPIRIVNAGESYWSISDEYGRTPEELAGYNGRDVRTVLRVGTRLAIPPWWPDLSTLYGDTDISLMLANGKNPSAYIVAQKGTYYNIHTRADVMLPNRTGWNPSRAVRGMSVQTYDLKPGPRGIAIKPLGLIVYPTGVVYNTPVSDPEEEDGFTIPSYQHRFMRAAPSVFTPDQWENDDETITQWHVTTSYFDPLHKRFFTWTLVPQRLPKGRLRLDILDVIIMDTEVTDTPSNIDVSTLPAGSTVVNAEQWTAGEPVTVREIFTNLRHRSPSRKTFWNVLETEYEGYVLERANGQRTLFRYGDDASASFEDACAPDEGCILISSGMPSAEGKQYFVDPISLLPNFGHVTFTDQNPAPPLTTAQSNTLDDLIKAAAVVTQTGVIDGFHHVDTPAPYDYIALKGGGWLDACGCYKPPDGSRVVAYFPVNRPPHTFGPVALVQIGSGTADPALGKVWYFNQELADQLK